MNAKTDFECKIKEKNLENICRLRIGKNSFLISQTSCIEILVSLIKASFDISHMKKELCNSEETLNIMSKPRYKLNIILLKRRVFVSLFSKNLLNLSEKEFFEFSKKISEYLNEEYFKGIINIHDLSTNYIEHMLGIDLPYLKEASYEKHHILDLELFDRNFPDLRMYANNHTYYNMLQNNDFSHLTQNSSCFLETEEERFKRIIFEIKQSFPTEKYYAVVYNDEMFVRDGIHRIISLYYLYGNIEISVLRLRFSRNFFAYSLYYANKLGERKRLKTKDEE